MNKKSVQTARAAAALAIKGVLAHESLTPNLQQFTQGLSDQDRGLAKALAYGVCRHFFSLQQMVDKHLQKPLRKKDHDVYALLLIGAYQRFYLEQPPYAAIDSVVEAAKELKKEWAVKLVNAVMRKLNKQKKPKPQFEHSQWMVDCLKAAYPEHYRAIIEANNQQPPLCLRVNLSKISREDYQQKLKAADIESQIGELCASSLYLAEKPSNITSLPGFEQGLFSVQDESPQLCAQLLDVKPGYRVLDACAAPGGKTCHLLEHEPDIGELWAIDIDANRLERVEENLHRLDLRASVICADVCDLEAWYDGQSFDRILCDAPCSATGVIRRHPDIKLLREPSDIERLTEIQLQVLESLWQTLAVKGQLLYATCSIMPDENDGIIKAFLAKHSDAQLLPITLPKGLKTDYGWQMLPENHAQDGFFYAKLCKVNL